MSNLPDEDEEFLYGSPEAAASNNGRQSNSKNGIPQYFKYCVNLLLTSFVDEEDLYDLYGDDENKE